MKRLLVIAAATSIFLAGCAAAPPVAESTPALEAQAAVLEPKAQDIIDETFAALAAADAALDPALLAPRIGDHAAQVRAAEYAVTKATGAGLEVLPSEMQRIYVSQSETFPRAMAAVSVAPSDTLTPVVYMWVQDSIDAPYQLRGWAHMIPGATLPAMPGTVDGATQLALGDASVPGTPRAVLESYLEYLRQGATSELAAGFTPDSYATQLFAARDTLAAAAAAASGGYVDTIQPHLDGAMVLSSTDGGSLVFVPVLISSSFSVNGATLTVAANDAPLLSGAASTKVTYDYRDLVVISVPASASGALPAVVAADHHLVGLRPE